MPADRASGDDGVARGVRLGIDLGAVRIGVARSDPDGMLATPVETVARDLVSEPTAATDLRRIVEIVRESAAVVVYMGLPRHLSGREGSASAAVRTYCGLLARAVTPVTVRLVDERLSTVSAHAALRASGRSGREHRRVVDQAAAVVILQSAIDAERTAGGRVGEVVDLPARDVEVDTSAGAPNLTAAKGTERMIRTAGVTRREGPQ
jgi:putative Holliday junction resolvase